MLRAVTAALALAALAVPVRAQHHGHDAGHAGATEASEVLPSGLSAAERDGLLAGAGLGLAAPADLNGYPGPLHVLQLADALTLTARQRGEAERLRAEVRVQALPLGAAVVAAEARLDALFASDAATPGAIRAQTAEIAALRGHLRAVHLAAHVEMRAALTEEQIATYDRLRARP